MTIRSHRRGGLALVLALGGPACRPAPAPPTAEPPARDVTPIARVDGETDALAIVQPAALPELPQPPPPPTAALPPGTPGEQGTVATLDAIDGERAIVSFFVPQWDGTQEEWLALMRRDGSLAWVQPLPDGPESEIVFLGDVVSVSTLDPAVERPPKVTLRRFSLADGAPRSPIGLGLGVSQGMVTDGVRRFDLRPWLSRNPHEDGRTRVVASTAAGVVWRALLPAASPSNGEPTLIGEAIAVRTVVPRDLDHVVWRLLDRKSGKPRGSFPARRHSCSDGARWFVVTDDGLALVDPRTLAPQTVTAPLVLPRAVGTWTIEDCTLVDGAPVVLAAQRERRALVALDRDGVMREHVELDAAARRAVAAMDPLPPVSHPVLALSVTTPDDVAELHLLTPNVQRPLERWRAIDPPVFWSFSPMRWRDGYLFVTHHVLVAVDAHTGALEGRAMIPADTWWPRASQLTGDTLWLPPPAPFRLGTAAPRLLDLRAAVPKDVREATAFDLRVEVGRGT